MLGFLGYKFTANRLAKKLEVNSLLIKDPNIAVLVKKIEHSLDIEEIKVYVLEDLNLNGVASPDGKIFITRGFLEKYYNGFFSAEELFGVITHELGHHALGHTKYTPDGFGVCFIKSDTFCRKLSVDDSLKNRICKAFQNG